MSEGFFAETVAVLAVEPLAFLLVEASPVFVERLSSTYTRGFGGAFLTAVVAFEVIGFAVVDFKTHKETQRVMLPDDPHRGNAHSDAPSHGIGVSPDGRMLWVDSSVASGVFAYSLPDLRLLGNVGTGSTPDWLTFTPDSKLVYVANAGENYVSAVDTQTLREVARIAVGEVPKRNGTVTLP